MLKKLIYLLIINLSIPILFAMGEPVIPNSAPNPEIVKQVKASVYEVIIPKPTDDSITYAKPLPIELLPYSFRIDKYYSIGSAFAIDNGVFMTAAHVLNLITETQFESLYIRNSNKEIFEIDQILAYSNHKDYAVFTAKKLKSNPFLKTNSSPVMNDVVYAVGNALGQGVIIRKGLFTSKTYEEENGKWQWLRFSAAASPGNSGGPLLNKNGEVIGIVTAKSPNENLNYSLPITEVLQEIPNKTAKAYIKHMFSLPIMEKKKIVSFNYVIETPKYYKNIRKSFFEKYSSFFAETTKKFLAENKNQIFPNGDGSVNLLHSNPTSYLPQIMKENPSGEWIIQEPTERKTVNLKNNGKLTYGMINNIVAVYLKKPEDISVKTLWTDSKTLLDLTLQGVSYFRYIMEDKTRIISAGDAFQKEILIDKWGRKWVTQLWKLEYNDSVLVTFSTPTPEGMITLMASNQTGFAKAILYPYLKTLLDFTYIDYYGTFAEWKTYLSDDSYLPKLFNNTKFNYALNKNKVYFKTNKVLFKFTPSFLKFKDKSTLMVDTSFYRENKKTILGLTNVYIGEDSNNNNGVMLEKYVKPQPALPDSLSSYWPKITLKQYPYDGNVYFEKGDTNIHYLQKKYLKAKQLKNKDHLYTLSIKLEGKHSDQKMNSYFTELDSMVKTWD